MPGGFAKTSKDGAENNAPSVSFFRKRKKMARKSRADGAAFARQAAAEAARELPAPPLPLSERALKYWPRVIGAKLTNLWTATDLDTAWGLCEDLATVEQARLALQVEPLFSPDEKGRLREHPASRLVEEIERRIQATRRHLQIHSAATNGPTHHQAGKNATARQIGQQIAGADDLIARPKGTP